MVPISAESRWTCSYLSVLEAGGDVNEQSQLQRPPNIAGKSFIQKKKKIHPSTPPPNIKIFRFFFNKTAEGVDYN